MAIHRSQSNKETRNTTERDEDETENNGYIQIFVKPLEQGSCNVILSWFGLSNRKLSSHQICAMYGLVILLCGILIYQFVLCDFGYFLHRLCNLIVPIFSISCGFYWVALYLRKSWSPTSIYVLFCACVAGEFLGQCVCDGTKENYITQPFLAFSVLVSVSIASLFSTLETLHSTCIIVFVSFIRFLACTTLVDLPQTLRPFLSYFVGIIGVIIAKYMETVFKPPINNLLTQDGKIPVIKRRRSSSSTAHAFSTHRAGRRTSLPALSQRSQVGHVLQDYSKSKNHISHGIYFESETSLRLMT